MLDSTEAEKSTKLKRGLSFLTYPVKIKIGHGILLEIIFAGKKHFRPLNNLCANLCKALN